MEQNNRIGFIVDGPGDFASFRKKFDERKCKILKTDGPRGHCAKIEDIISSSRKQVSILKLYKCNKAVLVLDMEERTIDYSDFLQKLQNELEKHDFGIDVFVAVSNRMIENWFLADISYLSKNKNFLKEVKKQQYYEGTHGKNILKTLFDKKYTYNEIKYGPLLFEEMRFESARKYSKSLNDFLCLLERINKIDTSSDKDAI